jgi:carbamoyl-phosphate synthase small subunit
VAPPGAENLPGADAPQASPGADGPLTEHGRGAFVAHDQKLLAPFDTPFGRAQVSHVNLNDGVVEGIRLLEAPAFSVQYHPEAAPGPHDAAGEFDTFCALMEGARHAQA